MSQEIDVPPTKKSGKEPLYQTELPSEKNFKAHLEFHLFDHGTRPDGHPERVGEFWSKDEFAVALAKARAAVRRYGGEIAKGDKQDARRSLDNWLRGKRCQDKPWGGPHPKPAHALYSTRALGRLSCGLFHSN